MKVLDTSAAIKMLGNISAAMSDQRSYLIELDSIIGDGDLGITMEKGFRAAYEYAQDNSDMDPGDLLMRCGMQIARIAPSTMGTLMGTGFMRGGKAVGGKSQLEPADLIIFFESFLSGVLDRGKAQPGDKTIVDVLVPMIEDMKASNAETLSTLFMAAVEGVKRGLEAEKKMVSQHGKAAVFREKSMGEIDPGSMAVFVMIEACYKSVAS